MSPIEHIQKLLEEIGPFMEPIEYVEQLGNGIWQVGVVVAPDVITRIDIEFDPNARKLAFEAEIGTPNPDQLTKLYETMLSYNALWRDTGGVRLALSDGDVVLVFDLFTLDLDLTTLASVIENLVVKVHNWRETVSSGLASENAAAAAEKPDGESTASDFLRA